MKAKKAKLIIDNDTYVFEIKKGLLIEFEDSFGKNFSFYPCINERMVQKFCVPALELLAGYKFK